MNPLLTRDHRIPFESIRPEHVVPGVKTAISEAAAAIAELIAEGSFETYEAVIGRLDDRLELLQRAFGLASHLNSVVNTPDMRAAYNEVLPLYVGFVNGLLTDQGLWQLLKAYAATPDAAALDPVRKRHLDKTMDEFLRAGADLSEEDRARAEKLQLELAAAQAKFSENVLDSTNEYELLVEDEADLAGLPEGVRRRARTEAESRGQSGWRFSLQAPSYAPFMKYAENRQLRKRMHEAFMSVATQGQHDNTALLREILAKRRQLANVLGYKDYADYTLANRMLGTGARAYAFEQELAQRARPYFDDESREIEAFAAEELGIERLEPWDLGFAMERLRQARFDFDEESLRPYLPLSQVLDGVFALSQKLFGVRFERTTGVSTWHPEVQTFDVFHEDGTYLGAAYTDWFPRHSKRKGAWMNELVTGGPRHGKFDPHVGIIAANFTPPDDGAEALLTHDEVQTVFHEFGHLLHLLLCRVEQRGRSSSNVAWDFIELPSQILENWTWEREALTLFAKHHETGEALPQELLDRLLRSRRFLEATAMMRQLAFGTADLALHIDFDPASDQDPLALADAVTAPLVLRPEFSQGRRLLSFTHVFSGGYAAGYYSYKWSEVLDADAFERFRAEGVLNEQTGREFANTILATGDSADANELFRAFMGRDPKLDALLVRTFGSSEAR